MQSHLVGQLFSLLQRLAPNAPSPIQLPILLCILERSLNPGWLYFISHYYKHLYCISRIFLGTTVWLLFTPATELLGWRIGSS